MVSFIFGLIGVIWFICKATNESVNLSMYDIKKKKYEEAHNFNKERQKELISLCYGYESLCELAQIAGYKDIEDWGMVNYNHPRAGWGYFGGLRIIQVIAKKEGWDYEPQWDTWINREYRIKNGWSVPQEGDNGYGL